MMPLQSKALSRVFSKTSVRKHLWGVRREGGSGWGTHVDPRLIHVNVWQKSLQHCKVISLQLIKINGKKEKTSILRCIAFFMDQLSHPYMTTGKTIALTILCQHSRPLLFDMLSRFVIAFLQNSKCLLSSWLQSSSAVIFEPKKINSVNSFHFFQIYLP